METSCLFPSAHSEDAIHFRPQCHLLARKSVGDFFPTNCRHAWHPHCGSCSYIQTLTSAVCFPNMCTRPVKPKHCVLVVIQREKQFKTLLLLTMHREYPDKCLKCNYRHEAWFVALLWCCPGRVINNMPLWVYRTLFEPRHFLVRCRRVWTCIPSRKGSVRRSIAVEQCCRPTEFEFAHWSFL